MIATLAMKPKACAKSRNWKRRVIASRSGSCVQSGKRASSAARAASSSFWTIRLLPLVKAVRSEEHTSELQSLMRISYAVFCLKKTKITTAETRHRHTYQQLPQPQSKPDRRHRHDSR